MTDGHKILQYIEYCGHSDITEIIEYNNCHYIYDPRYVGKDGYRYICPINGNILITSDFNECHFSFPDEFVKNNPYIYIKKLDNSIAGKGMDEANYVASLMSKYIYRTYPNHSISWELDRILNEEDLTCKYYWKWKTIDETKKEYE